MSILIFIVLIYLVIHVLCYRHHRRRGLSAWISFRGPFGFRIGHRL